MSQETCQGINKLSTLRVKAKDGFPAWTTSGLYLEDPVGLPFWLLPSNTFNKMKKKKCFFTTISIALISLAADQASAQQDSISTLSLADVTVTAAKFAKSQTETGKVLTIIDEAQLKQSAGKDISQLLNEQVGIFINGANSNPGKDKSVYLRGAKSEYTVILLDGIPLNDPSAIGGGAYDLRLIPLDQVERIEILKGNQSTLYGSNAVAGVINIITKSGGDKPITGTGTISYGSFNSLRGSLGISGGINKVDYSVGVTRSSTDGISEAKDTLDANRFDKDGFEQSAFHANVTIKPTKNFQFQPYFRFSDFDGTYDGGAFSDNPKNRYQSTLVNTGITAQMKLKKGAIHLYYGYDKSNREFLDSAYGYTSTYLYKGRFHHGEAFANYDFGKYMQVVGGMSYQSWSMMDTAAVKVNPSIGLFSPYVSFFVRGLKGFSVELGGRFNMHSSYGNNFTYSFCPSYLLANRVKFFLSASSGFKAPSLQQLYGQYGANENLKPETSQSIEGGLQAFLLEKKIDLRLVVFQRKIENVFFYAPQGYINQDLEITKGLDLEVSFAINQKWRVKSFYSFVNGSLDTPPEPVRSMLYRIPKHTWGCNLSWQVRPSWLVSANFKSVGKRMDRFFNPETFSNDRVSLNPFQLLDVYSEYALLKGKLKIFVDVKNVLNQNYYEVYGYSGLPINVSGGIRAVW